MSEPFSWTKFFSGLVDPTAYWKTIAIILRVGLMILVVIGIVIAGIKIKDVFFAKKTSNVVNITGQQGGEVSNSQDDSKHWTLLKLLTFDRK